jgi:hypothetical protein
VGKVRIIFLKSEEEVPPPVRRLIFGVGRLGPMATIFPPTGITSLPLGGRTWGVFFL